MKKTRAFLMVFLAVISICVFSGCATTSHDSYTVVDQTTCLEKKQPSPTEDMTGVSGRSKPAREGRMKTSHFEERIAVRVVQTAQRRDESTQREPATFDNDLGGAWLVPPADCA
jgi:hypothetical protein